MGRGRKKPKPHPPLHPEPAARPEPEGIRGWFRRLPGAVQWASGVVGLATAVLGLVFLLLPNLRPQPAAARSAKLAASLAAPLTQREYLLRIRSSETDVSPAQLERRGAVVDVDAKVEGHRGRRVMLRWVLIDAATGAHAAQDEALAIGLDSPNEMFSWPVWVPVPRPGRFQVLIELYPQEAESRPGVARIAHVYTDEFSWPPG
jgi:hypothetical protein